MSGAVKQVFALVFLRDDGDGEQRGDARHRVVDAGCDPGMSESLSRSLHSTMPKPPRGPMSSSKHPSGPTTPSISISALPDTVSIDECEPACRPPRGPTPPGVGGGGRDFGPGGLCGDRGYAHSGNGRCDAAPFPRGQLLETLAGQRGAACRVRRQARPPRGHEWPGFDQVAMPRSTSWPSGHSASAFAFTTGVGAAWPAAGLPLAVVASLVAYSRVHTGVHYPSDTIAGSVSGVALAPLAVAALDRRRRQPRAFGS